MATVRLTDELIEGLKAEEKDYDVFDTEVKTFGVRVLRSGEKRFFVLYNLRGGEGKGKKRRYQIGTYDPKYGWPLDTPARAARGKIGARDEARRIKHLVAQGADPQGERMGEKGALTFDELAARYLEAAKRKKRTWKQDQRKIGGVDEQGREYGHLLPAWRGRAASSITKRDVLALINGVVESGAPIAANRLRVLISRIFRWGAEQDLVENVPTMGTKPPAKERPGERVLSADELAEAYQRCTADDSPLGDIVRILILTWQRRAEISGILVAELREGLTILDIGPERMKNGRGHVVPLSRPVQGIIAARLARNPGGDRLFLNSEGAPIHADTVSDYIAALSRKMGGPKFSQRDLRRTGMTLAGRLHIGTKDDRSRVLSHTDPSVAGKHYDRYEYLDEKRAVLDPWGAYVEELAHVVALPAFGPRPAAAKRASARGRRRSSSIAARR